MNRLSSLAVGAAGLAGLTTGGLALFAAITSRRIERALPPSGRFIDAGGARIHYIDQGSGPPIVLIHGLSGQVRNFTHSLVARLCGDFRVIAIDRPGSGYSTRPRGSSARPASQAATIAAFIAALGLERPLLVGHSMGGAMALATALDHPASVGGLALLAPHAAPVYAVPKPFRLLAIENPILRRLAAWTIAIPSSIVRRDTVLGTLFGPEPVPADFATAGGSLLSLRPASFEAASADMMAVNEDLPAMSGRYEELSVPIGILFGDGDRVLDYRSNGRAIAARLANLDFELIEGGGHMTPITAPDRAAAFIRRIAGRMTPRR